MSKRLLIDRVRLCMVIAGILWGSAAAWAQPESEPKPGSSLSGLGGGDQPWAKGVSEEGREAANKLFNEGNELLMQQYFKEAAAKYRDALEHWEHPAIYYNYSLALMNLDRPIDLYHALTKATEYGVEPLVAEANYRRAEQTLNLLTQQLAHVDIACEEEGARVSLDGQLLFVGPGRHKGVTLAGEHTITATKQGYMTESRQAVLSAGKRTEIELKLFTADDLTYEKRRFARWIPWTVTGGGVAVSLVGILFHQKAKSTYASFDSAFDERCMTGCEDEQVPDLADRLGSARWQQRIGVTAYVIGGAALTTGVALIFLNQPRTYRREKPETAEGISLTPMLGHGTTGIRAGIRF